MEAPLGPVGCSVLGTRNSPRRAHGARGGPTWGWSPGGWGSARARRTRPAWACRGAAALAGRRPPCPQPLSGSGLGAPQPPCQASSHLPLGPRWKQCCLLPGLQARSPRLEGHWGPEGARSPRRPWPPSALDAPAPPRRFLPLSSHLLHRPGLVVIYIRVCLPADSPRPARTPYAADARAVRPFGLWTQEAPYLGLAHLSLGKGGRVQAAANGGYPQPPVPP